MSFVKAILGRIRSFSYPHWLSWALVCVALILASFQIILGTTWFGSLPGYPRSLVLAGILVGVVLAFFLGSQVKGLLNQRRALLDRMDRAEQIAADTNRRLAAVFRLSQKFVEANDEKEVDELVPQTRPGYSSVGLVPRSRWRSALGGP